MMKSFSYESPSSAPRSMPLFNSSTELTSHIAMTGSSIASLGTQVDNVHETKAARLTSLASLSVVAGRLDSPRIMRKKFLLPLFSPGKSTPATQPQQHETLEHLYRQQHQQKEQAHLQEQQKWVDEFAGIVQEQGGLLAVENSEDVALQTAQAAMALVSARTNFRLAADELMAALRELLKPAGGLY